MCNEKPAEVFQYLSELEFSSIRPTNDTFEPRSAVIFRSQKNARKRTSWTIISRSYEFQERLSKIRLRMA